MTKINNHTYSLILKAQDPLAAEKDYLECAVLEKLFDANYIGDNFVFAGGASLSKAYQLSMRIGQDIDLVCTNYIDLPDDHSSKQLMKFRKNFKHNVFNEVKEKVDSIINKNKQFLILTDADWTALKNAEIFMTSPTLHLVYKSEISHNMGHLSIEIIPRKYPSESIEYRSVIPYSIGCELGHIPTVRYENTFWDKVYALHSNAIASRPHFNQFYSRHYYDVATLASSQCVNFDATKSLLFDIEAHQAKYTSKCIEPIKTMSDVRLLPTDDILIKLGTDYEQMSDKFLARRDDWANIVQKLNKLHTVFKTL